MAQRKQVNNFQILLIAYWKEQQIKVKGQSLSIDVDPRTWRIIPLTKWLNASYIVYIYIVNVVKNLAL